VEIKGTVIELDAFDVQRAIGIGIDDDHDKALEFIKEVDIPRLKQRLEHQ